MNAYGFGSQVVAAQGRGDGRPAREADAGSLLIGLASLALVIWLVVRLRRWGRGRYIEREARLQAGIERRKRELLREQGEGR